MSGYVKLLELNRQVIEQRDELDRRLISDFIPSTADFRHVEPGDLNGMNIVKILKRPIPATYIKVDYQLHTGLCTALESVPDQINQWDSTMAKIDRGQIDAVASRQKVKLSLFIK